jgi:NADH dehydrogenase
MILITGGTGFIGRALVRHLTEAGYPVRLLIRPSKHSPELPRGVPVEVAVSSLTDERGLRSAMVDVDTIYHLAGAEWFGPSASLMETDIQGTQAVCRAAAVQKVGRIFYVSHLGAERASAFPAFKAKGIAEEHIRRSGVDFTILRSAIVFGKGDHFTSGLAYILKNTPFFFLVPEDGRTQLQPLWVEDLATCLMWSMDNPNTRNQTYSIGGPEYLSFNEVLTTVMEVMGVRRTRLHIAPPFLRAITVTLDFIFPGLPISAYWLDYLAVNRTCGLDTTMRTFNLIPGRFGQHLDHLRGEKWRMPLRRLMTRRTTSK